MLLEKEQIREDDTENKHIHQGINVQWKALDLSSQMFRVYVFVCVGVF